MRSPIRCASVSPLPDPISMKAALQLLLTPGIDTQLPSRVVLVSLHKAAPPEFGNQLGALTSACERASSQLAVSLAGADRPDWAICPIRAVVLAAQHGGFAIASADNVL